MTPEELYKFFMDFNVDLEDDENIKYLMQNYNKIINLFNNYYNETFISSIIQVLKNLKVTFSNQSEINKFYDIILPLISKLNQSVMTCKETTELPQISFYLNKTELLYLIDNLNVELSSRANYNILKFCQNDFKVGNILDFESTNKLYILLTKININLQNEELNLKKLLNDIYKKKMFPNNITLNDKKVDKVSRYKNCRNSNKETKISDKDLLDKEKRENLINMAMRNLWISRETQAYDEVKKGVYIVLECLDTGERTDKLMIGKDVCSQISSKENPKKIMDRIDNSLSRSKLKVIKNPNIELIKLIAYYIKTQELIDANKVLNLSNDDELTKYFDADSRESLIKAILQDLRIFPEKNGYYYLIGSVKAVLELKEEGEKIINIGRVVREVSQQYDVSPEAFSKAMEKAIKIGYDLAQKINIQNAAIEYVYNFNPNIKLKSVIVLISEYVIQIENYKQECISDDAKLKTLGKQ